jgi:hypothetical protein
MHNQEADAGDDAHQMEWLWLRENAGPTSASQCRYMRRQLGHRVETRLSAQVAEHVLRWLEGSARCQHGRGR